MAIDRSTRAGARTAFDPRLRARVLGALNRAERVARFERHRAVAIIAPAIVRRPRIAFAGLTGERSPAFAGLAASVALDASVGLVGLQPGGQRGHAFPSLLSPHALPHRSDESVAGRQHVDRAQLVALARLDAAPGKRLAFLRLVARVREAL
jgi:hypothetical protein